MLRCFRFSRFHLFGKHDYFVIAQQLTKQIYHRSLLAAIVTRMHSSYVSLMYSYKLVWCFSHDQHYGMKCTVTVNCHDQSVWLAIEIAVESIEETEIVFVVENGVGTKLLLEQSPSPFSISSFLLM